MSRARWSRKIRRATIKQRLHAGLRGLLALSASLLTDAEALPSPRRGSRGGRWRPRYGARFRERRFAAYLRAEYGSVVVHSPPLWLPLPPNILLPVPTRPRWQDTAPICRPLEAETWPWWRRRRAR